MTPHREGSGARSQSETFATWRQPMALPGCAVSAREEGRERRLLVHRMDTRSEPKAGPPQSKTDTTQSETDTPPREPHEGQGEEDEATAALDPHPDNDDDFEGDDGGRQSEEALLENPGH